MAFHVSRQVGWGSNYTPDPSQLYTYKYFFNVDVDVDCISLVDHTATIRVWGTYRVRNSGTGGPPNRIGAASDFAVLAGGAWDESTHAFDHNQNYYQASLPMMPNADSDLLNNKIVLEFRGDTYSATGNKSSVYAKGVGVNPDTAGGTFDTTYNVDTTFTIYIPDTGNIPILTWTTSGWGPAHVYDWLVQETWASWFDLKWNATMHFDANGGSGGPADIVEEVTGGDYTFTVPATEPTRKHFIFHGWSRTKKVCSGTTWYTEADAEVHAGDRITVTKGSPTVNLYAVWEYTYRPGEIMVNSAWQSCDRDTNESGGTYRTQLGRCDVRRNGSWVEMRTRRNKTGTSNSPVVRNSSVWKSQNILGNNGGCHNVSY